jgi:DNA-binding GntR family transcriptional regulator
MNAAPLRQHALPVPASLAEQAIELRRSQTLVAICEKEIERMILDADLEMGARINELALAARLGISRGPVREACRALVQAGLLETHANRGFFVRKLAHSEVVDLYDLRAGLMRLAGQLVAQRAQAEQVAHLRSLADAMDAACAKGNTRRFQDLNIEFHAALVQATRNRRLQEVYQGLSKESRLFRRRALVSKAAMKASNQEHRAIVEAVARHDSARAAATMESHILRGKERFLSAASDQMES